ncbi:MAG TPA: prolyl oligopeptidase family serine peptidase [Spirochaetia bacterium]|nr:prolyl oligopeptidase family serine peptidase [Spirochaetia bacterium]
MRKIWALGLCLVMICALPVAGRSRTLSGLPRQKKILVEGKSVTVRYLLYLPGSYSSNERKKWPLILFLHGSTEKGSDVQIVKRSGLPAYLEQLRGFPFIVISPQLDADQERWDPTEIKMLLDAVLPGLRVDRDRIYLTGWSLGANGVWRMAIKYPYLFAAIAPIAGWGDTNGAKALKNTPTWVFHGAKDTNVPPGESSSMVEALRKEGAKVRFTLYPDLDHECWMLTYQNDKLYDWFLQHRRIRAGQRPQGSNRT